MRTSSRITQVLPICLALVLGCAAGAAIDNLIVPARAAPGPSYEYMVIDVQASWGLTGGNAEKQGEALNQFGAEGWRVVATLGAKIYFERPIGG